MKVTKETKSAQKTRLSVFSIMTILMSCLPNNICAQIPMRAEELADSIVRAHNICEQSEVIIKHKVFYPKDENNAEIYFFKYTFFFNNEYKSDLSIAIQKNFSIKYVYGFPDGSFPLPPCSILPRRELWKIARKNGLRTRYKKCRYFLSFSEGGISVCFHERRTIYNMDFHSVNAHTGKYVSHSQGNVTF